MKQIWTIVRHNIKLRHKCHVLETRLKVASKKYDALLGIASYFYGEAGYLDVDEFLGQEIGYSDYLRGRVDV